MLLDTLFPRLRASDDSGQSWPPGPDADFWYSDPGQHATSGQTVTRDSAMAVSAVFACVRLLATAVATIPQKVYQQTGEDRKRLASEHQNYDLLHRTPNAWQVPSEYYELFMVHCLLRGNFYAQKVMDGRGRIVQLVPLHPDRIWLDQLPSGRLRFVHRPANAPPRTFVQDEIHHVRGLSLDGVVGVSVLAYARNAIGLSSAQETHGAALFKNGSIPPYFITAPRKMGAPAKAEFRQNWRGMHGGAHNAHNPPVFDDGMEAKALGLTNEDSQWLESRKFQAEEIARFFGVPPHKIALLDRATFSNIEHQAMEYVTDSLMFWLVRMEQCEVRDLFDPDEPFFPEFLVESRLRGDTASRYNAYSIGIKSRFLTPNEARARENLNPIDGGDDFPETPGVTGRGGSSPDQSPDQQPPPPPPANGANDANPNRAAFEVLLRDAAERIAAAEIRGLASRADKAAVDRPQWEAWARDFFDRHAQYVAKVLDPVADAWACATGHQVDVQALADHWCKSALAVLIDSDAPAATIDHWGDGLPKGLAALLTVNFFPEP